MTLYDAMFACWMLLMLSVRGTAQGDTKSERWNLYYQATSIGDYHGTFRAPYVGTFSLQDYPEHDVSLTTTLFFTAGPNGEVNGLFGTLTPTAAEKGEDDEQ